MVMVTALESESSSGNSSGNRNNNCRGIGNVNGTATDGNFSRSSTAKSMFMKRYW